MKFYDRFASFRLENKSNSRWTVSFRKGKKKRKSCPSEENSFFLFFSENEVEARCR